MRGNGGAIMPFNKETGAAAGKKGGSNRWKNKEPSTVRNVHYNAGGNNIFGAEEYAVGPLILKAGCGGI